MTDRDPEKLSKLLRQNQLRKRAAQLVGRWAEFGVSVSPVAHERYCKLIDRFRSGCPRPFQDTNDLDEQILAFVGQSDITTVLSWNVEDEPALLISSEALVRAMSAIGEIYPDGFILINESTHSALLVDIGEDEGILTSRTDMPV